MTFKASLAIILAVMLLTDSVNAAYWQGTGSGMNNTVLSEIWYDISNKIRTATSSSPREGAINLLTKNISDRLNAQWDPAWNVVYVVGIAPYDTILYGYAFKNQWMWFNAVPADGLPAGTIVSLLVWKDYNCKDWRHIGNGATETSSFTTQQKDLIKAEMDSMIVQSIYQDVWGTAFNMMRNLQANEAFLGNGYTVIMTQSGYPQFFGYVCRVGDKFYNSYQVNNGAITQNMGAFYLFQTR